MGNLVFLGSLEGNGVLLDGKETSCGYVRHSFRLYRDAARIAGVGKIWGEPNVLQRAVADPHPSVRLSTGGAIRVIVRREVIDQGFVCVAVDGPVPGYDP